MASARRVALHYLWKWSLIIVPALAAIAVFFAIAQTFGAIGPWLYGMLIGNGQDHFKLFIGYMIGAGVMIVGGVVEIFLGVAAEGQSLEDVASPLSSAPRPSALSNVTGAPRPPAARTVL